MRYAEFKTKFNLQEEKILKKIEDDTKNES